jgi:hypothetical protein
MFIGYIYKITGACGSVYIGSTNDFANRIGQHINDKNESSFSRKLKRPLNFKIIRKDQYKLTRTMHLVEQFYIENTINCVNTKRAYSKNRDKIYYKKHADKIREKANNKWRIKWSVNMKCVYCDSIITFGNMLRHQKENKQCLAKQKKEYCKSHKNEISERSKKWREENKEKLKEKRKIKIECKFCKTLITKCHMSRHHKTKKCLAIQKSLSEAKY